MADAQVLKSETRQNTGGRDAGRLRKNGRVPAVVYGHGETPAHISIGKDDLAAVLKSHSRTVSVVVGGKSETALIQAIQRDHLGSDILHIDFRRVSADERVRTTVTVELKGLAPGVLTGGVLDHQLHKIHVECSAMAIPDSIRVRIDGLALGMAIHAKELDLPAGVTSLEDPEAVVVQVKTAQVIDVPVIEAAVEPEVIVKKKEKAADDE